MPRLILAEEGPPLRPHFVPDPTPTRTPFVPAPPDRPPESPDEPPPPPPYAPDERIFAGWHPRSTGATSSPPA
jgi:hypothetical protein